MTESSRPRIPVREAQVQANDAPIHVIEQGEGPAVLFCHGFPDTAQTWRSQMEAVALAGYHAIAIDMRGFGASYAPEDESLYSAPHITADLVGVLDALEIDTATLVGHDWGAEHCWRAMLMRPDRFRAIVSLSIPFAPRGEQSHWQLLRDQGLGERYYAFDMMKPGSEDKFADAASTIPSILYWLSGSPPRETKWDPIDPAKHMLRPSPVAVPSWADPDYVAQTIKAFEATGFHGGLNYYRAAQATFDLMPAFKNRVIEQPSLYIYGAQDGLADIFHPTPPTLAELRKANPGLVDVIRLEDAGHWIQHEAADRLNDELVKFLDAVHHRAAGGLTPLMVAAGRGQVHEVKRLLAEGADVLGVEPSMGATALHKAALSGNADVIALLLDHGAFIDQQSPIVGNTPLMDAVEHRHVAAVTLLLERGARITPMNHHGKTALDLAQAEESNEMARLIEAPSKDKARQALSRPLIAAAKAGDLRAVHQLVAEDADLEARTPMLGDPDDDYTALGLAAREGHAEIVGALLDAGADPRQLNGLMRAAPVHEAAFFGHDHVLRVLTGHPANAGPHALELDKQGDYNGYTAVHDAIWQNHPETARTLVQAGARLDLRTHADLTPVELANHLGHSELARWLADAESQGDRP